MTGLYHVEVLPRIGEGLIDSRGESIRRQLMTDHDIEVTQVRSTQGYLVKGELGNESLNRAANELFSDPVLEYVTVDASFLDNGTFDNAPDISILIGFKPGVTDNRAQAALDGFRTLFPERSGVEISTTLGIHFWGTPSDVDAVWLAGQLHNPLIERAVIADRRGTRKDPWPTLTFPERPPLEPTKPKIIDLEVPDEHLIEISDTGLLALNLIEMKAIQAHYRNPEVHKIRSSRGLPPNAPTDVELECLAQSWSEHCKHKIFAAHIHHVDHETGEDSEIDSLFKTHIMNPALEMQEEVDWLLSLFHDNSGVIEWTEDWSLCMKAETHNSPSALDPYGGAMTGIVGVNRDILGTGLGARPIANTDVFCFGPPDFKDNLPDGLFHPSRVMRGVHAGVRAGGNESGIPTVNGAIVFDDRYIGKPLVYCGTVGILPRLLPDGRESHIKTPTPGDLIYMVGGRVGSDGIHGATFSSLELTDESPSSAVQIGDPITQKKMLDMLLEARDAGQIQVITDNGAGGLSSSVGEMAELTKGADLDLAAVPLKQAGLSSWEILVSESQERMTVGVREEDAAAFEALAALHEVEATIVGTFTDSGTFLVRHGDAVVADLPISFLHDGCPQLQLESEWRTPEHKPIQFPEQPTPKGMGQILCDLLSRPNIATKEWWVRSYDHEVIAQSVIKPFGGVNHDAPGDAAVIAPLHGDTRGAVISCGIVPRYSDLDAYSMAAASIDEAVRNAVCVGVNLDRMAGLDNFCWPDPVESEKTPDGRYKLAQLVRANRALDDVCRAYGLPCISGKDSMKNDATLEGRKISVPPTLLFSLIGDQPDVRTATSSDFKKSGDSIYIVGETRQELGASEFSFMLRDQTGGESGIGGRVPSIEPERNLGAYRALTAAMRNGLVASAHDCSDGGLASALAESCFGVDAGASVDIGALRGHDDELDAWGALFGESLGRILVSVKPEDMTSFESAMQETACTHIGIVGESDDLVIKDAGNPILEFSISELRSAWKNTLNGSGSE
tara:strand:+ start:147 stop:3188 length:3042 start_codon:yes stop_codon:yes gene_type:complete